MNRKLIFRLMPLFFLMVLSASCGTDSPDAPKDDSVNSSDDSSANKLIGVWYNRVSYGGIFYTFNADGTAKWQSPEGTGERGTWKYIEESRMLTTTLHNGFDNWEVFDISSLKWTGQIHTSSKPVITYERVDYIDNEIVEGSDWYPKNWAHKLISFNEYDDAGNCISRDETKLHFYTDNYAKTNLPRELAWYTTSKRDSKTGFFKLIISSIFDPSPERPYINYKIDIIFDSPTTFTYSGVKEIDDGESEISLKIHGNGSYKDKWE